MDKARSTGALRWGSLLLLFVLACAALLVVSRRAAIDPAAAPAKSSFTPELVARGARLAAIGDCAGCHSSAAPLAGGVAMHTSFGIIYSTNITPDTATGIGAWTEAAFARAMREGVARDGSHLYPAFPYEHFTRLTDADIHALYAWLMTRDAVSARAPANRLIFPLGFRPLLAGWKLLFLERTPPSVNASQDAAYQRGAYLADALGHCGACHTPRNRLGAEERRHYLEGGEADGWHATALNAASPSPQPWSEEQLAAYLRTGMAPNHAIAGGPMQLVVQNLAAAGDDDIHALAVYIHAMQSEAKPPAAASERRAQQPLASVAGSDAQWEAGRQVYAQTCARCHDAGREPGSAGALQMPLAIANYLPDARNLIHIIRDGIHPPDNTPGRWMPAFGSTLTNAQLTALAAFLRHNAADAAPWPDLADAIKKTSSP
ncbi:cytochrome c [Noviherbaspirillum pedocola]|uniref:Cytochrome c n=1 Tax=Noviherbaspirillum pedocola TaxID=2801341 RepID=A0A934SW97_9BURK|nr:cytochrome c [Noviherbaspirillum pedocola]MBK4736927.1 cytochrome c [Noviherbaspirillum pedocola]